MKLKTLNLTILLVTFLTLITLPAISGFQGSFNSIPIYITPPVGDYSYLIDSNGTYTIAKNGTTGKIEFGSTNASAIMNMCYGNLSNGGTIHLKSLITCDSTVKATNDTVLEGEGWQTGLKLASGKTSHLLENVDKTTNGNKGIVVRNLKLEGQYFEYSSQGNLIDFQNPSGWSDDELFLLTLVNVFLLNANKDAIRVEYGRVNFDGVTVVRCRRGFDFEDVYDSMLANVHIETCTNETMYVYKGKANMATNVYLGGYPSYPQLVLDNTKNNVLTNFQVDHSKRGGVLLTNQANNNLLSNFDIEGVSEETNATYDGVTVEDSSHNLLSNFWIGRKLPTDTKLARYGIYESGTSDYNTYVLINAYDVGTSGIILAGADSHCNHSWNMSSWIS